MSTCTPGCPRSPLQVPLLSNTIKKLDPAFVECAGFPAGGMPSQDTTDKLASLMAKVKKKAGNEKAPFPYFDVGDFVPDWSGVSPHSFFSRLHANKVLCRFCFAGKHRWRKL